MMPGFEFAAGSVLIASADELIHRAVMERLPKDCTEVHSAAGGAAALARLEQGDLRFLFLDRQLPDLDAEEVRGAVQTRFPQVEVVMVDPADYDMTRSSPDDHVKHTALDEALHWKDEGSCALPGMVGESAAMRRLYRKIRLVAGRITTVLISGPTGCGKELVARAVHELSPRARKPFVVVNCAAIPDPLIESELFGHMRGAFTGAVQAQPGRIPAAHGGTLFLDEVGDLSLAAQAKLLRFLELREVQRLGATDVFRVDVRVIAASHRDLADAASRGEFREDLYYRLAIYPLVVPALVERDDDVVRLAEHALRMLSPAGRNPPRLNAEARLMLTSHAWRGNVRELQHVMERALILSEGSDSLRPEHIWFAAAATKITRVA